MPQPELPPLPVYTVTVVPVYAPICFKNAACKLFSLDASARFSLPCDGAGRFFFERFFAMAPPPLQIYSPLSAVFPQRGQPNKKAPERAFYIHCIRN
jgi:hypothetical protein